MLWVADIIGSTDVEYATLDLEEVGDANKSHYNVVVGKP